MHGRVYSKFEIGGVYYRIMQTAKHTLSDIFGWYWFFLPLMLGRKCVYFPADAAPKRLINQNLTPVVKISACMLSLVLLWNDRLPGNESR